MELSKDTRLMEVAASPATTSYEQLLAEQKDLFQNQIEKLQQIVATQCKLTGVNPLSQEMAASALSIKIGKKPRDLLNPKAVKYMLLMFSMKDAISKRETREISAQFGITVTQVRDFFSGQRTRVRKFVRLCREQGNTPARHLMHGGITAISNSDMPIEPIPLDSVAPIPLDSVAPIPLDSVAPFPLDSVAPIPLDSVAPIPLDSVAPIPLDSVAPIPLDSVAPIPLHTVAPIPLHTVAPIPINKVDPIPLGTVAPIPLGTVAPIPLDTVAPHSIDEGPSCSKRHEDLSGLADSDMHFVKNIFDSMRKEESFSGQIKLMRWILRINNPSVLNWFLIEGGLMILATWLSEAAIEEQTSYLLVLLKLLDYLPISKALPGHMSAILQSVNGLQFYRASDISHRARPLLSKWSRMLGRNLSSKKSNALKSASDLQDEMLLKQSINEVMGNESWDLKKENPEDSLRLMCDNPDSPRKLDTAQPLKMLTASGDDSVKRRGVFPPQTRERRKVQLVEHPGERLAVRSPQVARSTSAAQSRPLSADDIQKAKIRAQFMQNKHGKTITNPDEKIKPESEKWKPENENKWTVVDNSHVSLATSVSKSNVQTELEEQRRVDDSLSTLSNPHEIPSLNLEEPPWKKHKRIPIPWQIPPEVKMEETWSVGDGAHSKEVEVQKSRIRREREVVYRTIQEIPCDPREPWDREMDCDDSLTPEIPTEQLPDVEPLEASSSNPNHSSELNVASGGSESIPEPDFELLAELLKNPELVFALTSGQAGNLSSEETVKLLDRIKANGVSSFSGNASNEVEVSLPSPTPSTDPVPNGGRLDFSRNPFSRQQGGNNPYEAAKGSAPIRQPGMVSGSTLIQSQSPATTIMPVQTPAVVQHYAHKVVQTPIQLPQQWQAHTNPQIYHQSAPTTMAAQPYLPKPQPSLYLQEPLVSNSLRAREGLESNNHPYQNTQSGSYHHAYAGGGGVQPSGAWVGRSSVADRPEYESWSPDNSPSRRREYLPSQHHNEGSVNLRNGYMHGKADQQNLVQPSGYQDGVSKQWQDRRR